MKISCEDQVILNQWHPISSLDVLTVGVIDNTVLLGSKISYQLNSKKEVLVWLRLDEKLSLIHI